MNERCAETDSPMMEQKIAVAASRKRLLYALIPEAPQLKYESAGIGDTCVYTISEGGISAVVSDIHGLRLRPERRNIAAHQGVLNRLMEFTTPLPMAFGTIADCAAAVREMLACNLDAISKQLNRVAGKAEMILRVKWDVPNIFEYFVLTHRELMLARDRLFGTDCDPSQDDKLEIGRLFERLLEEEREALTEKVEKAVSGYGSKVKRNKCRNELEVMNLACLVPRESLTTFEDRVLQAARPFDNNFAFDYNGPWPPYNFVELSLEL
ncbi:MAG: GvpL/GvpF family gas vesicle protein [Acidobacteriota bacterium]